MTIVLVENSTWTNVGDGFYQNSLLRIFRHLWPASTVNSSAGGILRSHRPALFFKSNCLDLSYFYKCDVWVLSGPILNKDFFRDYAPQISNLLRRGGRYILCSVHAKAENKTLSRIIDFLNQNPPVGVWTRDEYTYQKFKSALSAPLVNGVCAASFIGIFYSPASLDIKPYVAVSVYNEPEPRLQIVGDAGSINDLKVFREKPLLPWRIARHFDFLIKKPSDIDGYRIIRTHHAPDYKFSHLNFNQINTFLSYNPETYFAIYKNSKFVVTNRVHAAVAALSLGKKVRYWGATKRGLIFSRLGLDPNGVMELDRSKILSEFDHIQSWLHRLLDPILGPQ